MLALGVIHPCANKCLNCTDQLPDWMIEAFYAKEKLVQISILAVNYIPFALAAKRRASHKHTEGRHCMGCLSSLQSPPL